MKQLYLYADCTSIDITEWKALMKGTKSCSGRVLRNKIKTQLPELYDSLCLDFPNPYEGKARHKEGLYVYVHSAIEYFIKY